MQKITKDMIIGDILRMSKKQTDNGRLLRVGRIRPRTAAVHPGKSAALRT